MEPIRLQKFLAQAGVASRRAGERLITEGRVEVNGRTVTTLGTQVVPGQDIVAVEGKPVHVRRRLYVALNKPRGYLCTRKDPEGRHTVFNLLPKDWSDVYPVGRLDRDTEGLLFLTNDGEFCLRLTHPRFGLRKTYRALLHGRAPIGLPALLTRGLRDRGEFLKAERARLLQANNSRSLVELDLQEGKYREVRRLLAGLSMKVEHLQRLQIGPIKLGELPLGRWRILSAQEVAALRAPPQS